MKKIFVLTITLCFAWTAIIFAADAYESIYQIPLKVPYCSSEPEGGELGKYPCDADSYLHWEAYTGFKKQWNPNDPKRRCQQDTLPCPDDKTGMIQYALNLVSSSYSKSLTGDLFRYYIPKGTMFTALNLFGPPTTGKCATLARFGRPPTSDIPTSNVAFEKPEDYPQYFPPDQYKNGRSDFWRGKTLEQLEQNDWFAVNEGGHITILYSNDTPLEEGQWLYIRYIYYDTSKILSHIFSCTTDEEIYTDWYNSYNGYDAYGDPPVTTVPEKPGKAVATPSVNGVLNQQTGEMQWTASPQTLSVTSTGADKIFYNVSKTTDGSVPTDPKIPTQTSYDYVITGAAGRITLTSDTEKLTRYKIRIVGGNSVGVGTESGILKYAIDLTPKKPDVPAPDKGSSTVTTSPLVLNVASNNATKIYYELSESQDDPITPTEKSQSIVGPTGAITLNGVVNQKKMYRVIFRGWNGNGGDFGNSSEVYTYIIDLTPTPPGDVTVSPGSGTYTTAKSISVSSDKAAKIYIETSQTTDGVTEPAEPKEPTTSSKVAIEGASGSYSLPCAIGAKVWTKVKFRGYNTAGIGATSSVYYYKVELNSAPGQPVASPTSGNFTVSPATITITSTNADTIVYSTEKTENGQEPADPYVPMDHPFGLVNTAVNGKAELKGNAGVKTIYKVIFQGKNTSGYSAASTIYRYTIDLTNGVTKPGDVTVSPGSGTYAEAKSLTVTSSSATKIYVESTKTTDGTTPADPKEPTTSSTVAISGASGAYTLPSTSGAKAWIKVRFRGYNTLGLGTSSAVYYYKIEPTSGVPGQPVATPETGKSFTASPATISVTSTNADAIYYTTTDTTDGSEPTTPPEPQYDLNIFGLGTTAKNGKIELNGKDGLKTIYKVIFQGKNGTGFGTASTVYTYTIDLGKPDQVKVSPDSGTICTVVPQQISVASANATTIEYVYRTAIAENPSPVSDPSSGTTQDGEMKGVISGAAGAIELYETSTAASNGIPVKPLQKNIIRIKLAGKNSVGYGTTVEALYTVDLTPKSGGTISQNQAKNNPDVNVTSLIINDRNLTDPSQKILVTSNTNNTQQSTTEEKYSIVDLISMFFKMDYPKVTIDMRPFETGNVMIIGDPGWDGYVFPFVVDKLITSSVEKAACINQFGNIDVTMNNIKISLSPAGAFENQIADWLKDKKMNISYGDGHIGKITADGTDTQFVVRYQVGAQLPEEAGDGSACTLNQNEDGSIQIVYGDKTTQNLIPYIHNPESFIVSMKANKSDAVLDWSNGTVHVPNKTNPQWIGLPSYLMDGSQTSDYPITLCEGTDMSFQSKNGTQSIEYAPKYFKH